MLTFELLRDAWAKVKISKAEIFNRLVPGARDFDKIIIKRIADTNHDMTVEFRGFEDAVTDPTNDIPRAKRAIVAWLRKISHGVQITRGNPFSLIVRIHKDPAVSNSNNLNMQTAESRKYEQPKNLTNITMVRKVEN